jgi:hypothetical protein
VDLGWVGVGTREDDRDSWLICGVDSYLDGGGMNGIVFLGRKICFEICMLCMKLRRSAV